MTDTKLTPLRPLLGTWNGSGQGPQGLFEVRAEFEERGRWILLRHQISPPGGSEPFYYSTQVFGYDEGGLMLNYFDTAGSFLFRGERDRENLAFSWKNDDPQGSDVWKTSKYTFAGENTVSFSYNSCERQNGEDAKVIEFTGALVKA
jgi:hypothetical protein